MSRRRTPAWRRARRVRRLVTTAQWDYSAIPSAQSSTTTSAAPNPRGCVQQLRCLWVAGALQIVACPFTGVRERGFSVNYRGRAASASHNGARRWGGSGAPQPSRTCETIPPSQVAPHAALEASCSDTNAQTQSHNPIQRIHALPSALRDRSIA